MIILWKSPIYLLRSIVALTYRFITRKPLLVSPIVEKKRLNICNGCWHERHGQCDLCGCFVSVKAAFYHERCPAKTPRW